MNGLAQVVAVVLVTIVVHELAHLAAARAVGHEVFEIQLGGGPLWTRWVGDVEVHVGPLPLGGHVQTGSESGDGFRWRSAVVAGSGVAANGALAVVGLAVGASFLFAFNVIAIAVNLWPGARRTLGDGSSDGRMLLDLARNDADALAEERSGWFAVKALRALDAGDLSAARAFVDRGRGEAGETRALLAVAGLVALRQNRFGDVVDAYAPLIDHPRVSVSGRAGFAADAAWAASLADDPSLRRFAEPWAAFARRVRPRVPRRRMVHALALVDAGCPDDALELLVGLDDPAAAAVRALALAAAGDPVAAREAASGASALAPDHPLARRVAALDDAPDGSR